MTSKYPSHPKRKQFFVDKKHHYLFQLYGAKARYNGEYMAEIYIKTKDFPVLFFLIDKGLDINESIEELFINSLIQNKHVSQIIKSIKKQIYSLSSVFEIIIFFRSLNKLNEKYFVKLFNIIQNKKIDPEKNYGLSLEKLQLLHKLFKIDNKELVLNFFKGCIMNYDFKLQEKNFIDGIKLYLENKFIIGDLKLLHDIVKKMLSHKNFFELGFGLCEHNYEQIDFHILLSANTDSYK